MFSYLDYLYEMYVVMEKDPVYPGLLDIAYDKVRTDIRFGQAFEYNTGDMLPEFDYAKAKVEYDAMIARDAKAEEVEEGSGHEWDDAIEEMSALRKDKDTRRKLSKAYPDREAFEAIVAEWKAEYHASEE